MKTKIKHLMIALFLMIAPAFTVLADDPDGPPNPGGDPGTGGGLPVGAPIDGGVSILLLLGAGYAAYKIKKEVKKREAE